MPHTVSIGENGMKKNAILKFIDKSKEIINNEVSEEINEPKINGMDSQEENNIISEIRGSFLNADDVTKEVEVETPKEEVNMDNIDTTNLNNSYVEETTSNVASDMVIKGNISAQGNLNFNGDIEGDVECHRTLRVKGKIVGNIKASQVSISDSEINGNILSENLCEILNDTKVNGDVTASTVMIEGSVFGTVNASEKVTLCNNAILEGDCIAARIKIEEGAVIKGNIQTTK